ACTSGWSFSSPCPTPRFTATPAASPWTGRGASCAPNPGPYSATAAPFPPPSSAPNPRPPDEAALDIADHGGGWRAGGSLCRPLPGAPGPGTGGDQLPLPPGRAGSGGQGRGTAGLCRSQTAQSPTLCQRRGERGLAQTAAPDCHRAAFSAGQVRQLAAGVPL